MQKRMILLISLLIMGSILFFTGCTSSSEPFPPKQGLLTPPEEGKILLLLFWGNGCPHCEREIQFLKSIQAKYPELEIRSAETWGNKANAQLYQRFALAYNDQASGVPGTFIGEHFIKGFGTAETTGKQIESWINECMQQGCPNPLEKIR